MNFFKKLFRKESNVISDPDKVPDAMKEAHPVVEAIGAEAISCTPENWTNAVLTITFDGQRIGYSLKNHRGEKGKAGISPRLAQLAEQLISVMASHGDHWTQAVLTYDQGDQGWNFKINFSY